MPRAEILKLPPKCLEGSKFTKEEQLTIVRAMLLQINFKIMKAHTLKARIPFFGLISTHGNKKSSKNKYQEKYNRRLWKKQKLEMEFSEKHLLF